MPRRQRAAESSRVTFLPAKLTWPAPGARSPEMRPNRLVLPAPFGPTIPTVSPALTEKLRSSAMTTRPNRFVTWSSSRSGLVMLPDCPDLAERWQQVAGDLCVRLQGDVDHLGLKRVLGPLLPLDAHRRGDRDAGRGVGLGVGGGVVDGAGHRLRQLDLEQRVRELLLVVRVVHLSERRVGDLEERVVRDVRVRLAQAGRGVGVRQVNARLLVQ